MPMCFSRYGVSQGGRFRMPGQRGFTLIELLIGIAVLAVLLAIAIPAFNEVTLSSKLRSQANDLAAGALLARSEAIKRNKAVDLCASSNGTSCSGTWVNGWIVKVSGGGAVIKTHGAAPSGFLINSAVTTLTFQPSGFGATATTLTVCRATPSVGGQERVLTVTATGRSAVTKETTGVCTSA